MSLCRQVVLDYKKLRNAGLDCITNGFVRSKYTQFDSGFELKKKEKELKCWC